MKNIIAFTLVAFVFAVIAINTNAYASPMIQKTFGLEHKAKKHHSKKSEV